LNFRFSERDSMELNADVCYLYSSANSSLTVNLLNLDTCLVLGIHIAENNDDNDDRIALL